MGKRGVYNKEEENNVIFGSRDEFFISVAESEVYVGLKGRSSFRGRRKEGKEEEEMKGEEEEMTERRRRREKEGKMEKEKFLKVKKRRMIISEIKIKNETKACV
jgi:hypothetical protein